MSLLSLVSLSTAQTASTPARAANHLLAAAAAPLVSTSTPAFRTSTPTDPYSTAYNYVVTFYPRWFTFLQSVLDSPNRLIAPNRISPLYHAVVAINDDTSYASTFIPITCDEPVIVTVPATTDHYSVLELDQYGFQGIPDNQSGVYALTLPAFRARSPTERSESTCPNANSVRIVRADKYVKDKNGNHHDMRAEADRFRRKRKAFAHAYGVHRIL